MDRIILGYDGSETSQQAAREAAEWSQRLGWEVTVLVVAELLPGNYAMGAAGAMEMVPPMLDTGSYERLVDEGVALCRSAGAEANGRLEWGQAADRIVGVAGGEGYRMVVVGHKGAGGLETLLMGSVAKHVIDRAHCSVLVVR